MGGSFAGRVELGHNTVVKKIAAPTSGLEIASESEIRSRDASLEGRALEGSKNEDESTREWVARSVLENGPSTAVVLGERLGLTPAGIRRHLDALVAQGILEAREPRLTTSLPLRCDICARKVGERRSLDLPRAERVTLSAVSRSNNLISKSAFRR